MAIYNESDLRNLNWRGLKTFIKAPLMLRPVNALVIAIASNYPNARWLPAIPVMRDAVEYRCASGATVTLANPARCDVARDIFWGGGQSKSRADQRALRCVEVLCSDARLFFDIGAYSGLFALVAARSNPDLVVYAYEIVPENYLLLVQNIIRNNVSERVYPRFCGLSGRTGEMTVPLSAGLSRLPSSISVGSQFSRGVRVPIETLDKEARQRNLSGRCVMKIDVEGFEADVIAGGRDFIRRVRPDIVCEILPSSQGAGEIEHQLTPLGYRFYQISDEAISSRDSLTPSRAGRDWLFLARDEFDPTLL